MYSEKIGQFHFWCSIVSVNMLFFPMHFVGLAGMPRRIPDYALQFADMNAFISIGGLLFGLSQLIFVWMVVRCMRGKGKKASSQVWEGAQGLEWEIPSPAPYHTFQTPPHVK